eukprot:gnl/TRDRNA2_/TRDRNA2_91205_c0_seq1.p1 gnl/TRDRNA2_/TRDRNA2_91205_c0~~gnl/TRDRNA2_/TRDRNA2_91205_c0_seq1.p1  ORF type:complete len:222 (+),score=45.22 gnl/TRDRNA2_/TRDRNA2_91205_c0_seq1:114-779(+)
MASLFWRCCGVERAAEGSDAPPGGRTNKVLVDSPAPRHGISEPADEVPAVGKKSKADEFTRKGEAHGHFVVDDWLDDGGQAPPPSMAKRSSVKDLAYYNALGVASNATEAEIRRAFKTLSLANHPDKGGDRASFDKICEAHKVLSDPDQRRKYDKFGLRAVTVPEMIEGTDPRKAERAARTEEDVSRFKGHRQSHYNEVEAVRRFKERQRLGLEDEDEDDG